MDKNKSSKIKREIPSSSARGAGWRAAPAGQMAARAARAAGNGAPSNDAPFIIPRLPAAAAAAPRCGHYYTGRSPTRKCRTTSAGPASIQYIYIYIYALKIPTLILARSRTACGAALPSLAAPRDSGAVVIHPALDHCRRGPRRPNYAHGRGAPCGIFYGPGDRRREHAGGEPDVGCTESNELTAGIINTGVVARERSFDSGSRHFPHLG
ncbi:hypothetical protein EVAR_67255_1 [Eumeta japonica]|uniref:Uncharacterized protein n=1 Tax=Eumeta variegata TaxID=151549 RepID=A0A4C1YPX3_EUMVA|nr:hypothetical protein EVAR_67255_1 [Eumeta japonica]